MHFVLNSSMFPGFLPPPVAGWILIWCSRLIWASPGSRRDPPPYIYSHKFAQLSPRSNAAFYIYICLKRQTIITVHIVVYMFVYKM